MVYFNRREGRTLKSVTIPVVGEGDRIIGLVCMNFQFHRHETEIPSAWNGSFIGME